jgi:hypothetical protein
MGDLYQHFAFVRRRNIDLDDFQGLSWTECNCST